MIRNKKAQEERRKSSLPDSSCLNRKGQEEMVGFALIVVLVSVILLILVSIIIMRGDKGQPVESYEAESFVQSILSYTTDCGDLTKDYLSLQQVIFKCMDNQICVNGKNTCEVLNSTIKNLIKESWGTNERPTKGFKFNILSEGNFSIKIEEGNFTGNSRTAVQPLIKSGKDIEVSLEIFG